MINHTASTASDKCAKGASEYWITLIEFFTFFFFAIFKKDPAGFVKHKINLVWPNLVFVAMVWHKQASI